jgi:gluconate 2-dehydrogenase gamma chain
MNAGPGTSKTPSAMPSTSPRISRRELIRAAVYAGVASALGPAFSFAQAVHSDITAAARGEDGSEFLANPNWKPVFLSEQQNAMLIAMSEVIIPATDSPGAKEALVNRYLDLLLSVQPSKFQDQFVSALEFIDAESQKQLGKNFFALSVDDQIWLLTPWAYTRGASHWTQRGETREAPADAGQEHFDRLKGLIAIAYYGSEIGQKELGWDGSAMNGPYRGCEHPATDHT